MREFDVIDRIRKGNSNLPTSVIVPPGDDLGALRLPDGGGVVLAGVDQVIGGVHLAHAASPEQYAWKVAARSLSDVAAMAACPVGMVVAAALSPRIGTEWTTRFSSELQRMGTRFDCPLIGGDIAVLPSEEAPMVFSSTVLAAPDSKVSNRMVLRDGARPGDAVCVSGAFGRSLAADGTGHHLEFTPRIDVGVGLHRALQDGLTSMIDVSDGLGSELAHLARESHVRIVVDAARIPRRDDASIDQALSDGEDYELCFTVSDASRLPHSMAEVPLTVIGTVEQGDGVVLSDGDTQIPIESSGWEHRGEQAGDSDQTESKGASQ